jgi:predicted nucleic acid-binding protein
MTVAKRSRAAGSRPTRGPQADAPEPVVRYIESSALLAALLEGDVAARASIRAKGLRVTSAVTLAETGRAIVRAMVTGRISDSQARAAARTLRAFERRTDVINVTDAVLARVRRPFPNEPVRTLDAIHLASLELLDSPPDLTTVITRDQRVRVNAVASGYAVE